jgi:hypothetical protein
MRWSGFLFCAVVSAQSLQVYSEFARINASGEVIAPAQPREILSPAIVRNGFTSFQIVIQVPKGTTFWLYVGQNPEDAVRLTIYRESGEKLEKIDLPFQSSSTEILWMDLWSDRGAPVRRIKVEPELNIASDWITYPMEVRVADAVVPDAATTATSIKSVVCSKPDGVPASDISRMHLRNAQQDVALATRVPSETLKTLGACDLPDNPESYFKIRDYLFRMR